MLICMVRCLQALMLQRIQALTSLLDSALAESEQHPERPLPGLAVTFAATQVQVFAPLLPSKSHISAFFPFKYTYFCFLAATPIQISAFLLSFKHRLSA